MSGFYGNILHKESSDHIPKIYPIQLKSLFSAFGLKSFAVISLRSFLMFYLPLLEPRIDEDADSEEDLENAPVDLVIPFKKSIKQIVREVILLVYNLIYIFYWLSLLYQILFRYMLLKNILGFYIIFLLLDASFSFFGWKYMSCNVAYFRPSSFNFPF